MADYNLGTARGVIELDYKGDTSIRRAQTDIDATGKSATKASGNVAGFKKELVALAGFGAATTIAAGFALAVKTTADFEAQISAIAAVSGATEDELESLRAKALQLGADTSFSASEAAAAMEELVKAGVSVDDVLNGAADAAVALAAAGGISIPEAATIAANAMNQFRLEAEDLGGVVDSIAGAANASAIDVGQLGTSLSQVGAVANLAGMTFEDTATAIALMGNAGIVGSDAGTSLKTMLQNLQPQTEKQISLFKELGLLTADGSNQFFDAEGNVKSYAKVSQTLADALEGQSNQQKLANLEILFGTDAIRAAAIAADAGAKGVRDLNEEMNKVTAAEVAAKRLDNFSGSLDALGGSLETAIIQGGSPVLVFLRDVVDFLSAGVNAGTQFGGMLAGELGPGFRDLFSAIGNVVSVGLDVLALFADLGQAGGMAGLGVIVLTFNTLASVLETVTGLLEGQGAVVAIVAGTWLLLANGGIAVVAARLGWFAAYAVVQALSGLVALQAGATATTATLGTLAASAASAAASLGAVALLVAAVAVWQAYKQAVEETDEALRSAKEARESGDARGLQAEIETLQDLIQKRKDLISEYSASDEGFGDNVQTYLNNAFNPTRWGDVGALNEWSDSMGALEAEARLLDASLDQMGTGFASVATSLGLLDASEAQEFMESFARGDTAALEQMDALLQEIQPLLDQAGYTAEEFMASLKGEGPTSLPALISDLERVSGSAEGAAGSTESLSDAAADFANDAKTAADQAKGLEEALNNLIGVELSAEEAAIAWRDGLRELTAGIKENGAVLKGNSEAADANKTLLIGSTKDILSRIAAEAKAGASLESLTRMFGQNREALLDNAEAAGLNRKEVDNLLRSYGFTPDAVRTLVQQVGAQEAQKSIDRLVKKYDLTPEEVTTLFEAEGADTAAEQIKVLRNYINGLKGKNAPIGTPGSEESIKSVEDLRAEIKVLQGKEARIGTPGARESQAEIQALRNEIEALRDRQIYITTTVRRVVEEVAGSIPFAGGGGGGGGSNQRSLPSLSDLPATRAALDDVPVTTGPSTTPSLEGSQRAGSSGPGAPSSAGLRLVEGKLYIDRSGHAFIEGVARDADDDQDRFATTHRRMDR